MILNDLLDVSDVAVQSWSNTDAQNHWAAQAAVNLTTAGVLRGEHTQFQSFDTTLTRAEVAELLDSSLDLLESRNSSWFS